MSSKLSKRRATVRKPKICVAASCPPPPPPPPPPTWPPDEFDLTFTYTYDKWGEIEEVKWTVGCERQGELWRWVGMGDPPESPTGEWEIDTGPKIALLSCSGVNEVEGHYMTQQAEIPVIWDTPTDYVIGDWIAIPWWMLSALAEFRF